MNNNSWFSVDRKGLSALQEGKEKTYIVSELSQNAFDEDVKDCELRIEFLGKKKIRVTVKDDSPEGFRDISHAHTLFADTYKRKDPEKRGRFNLGEKQVISICEYAKVKTTKGTVEFTFDKDGNEQRIETPNLKTEKGSIIEVIFTGTKKESNILYKHARRLLVPNGINFTVNGVKVEYRKPYKTFEAKLDTEILKGKQMVPQFRKTKINLIEHNGDDNTKSYLYEMGIPVMPIDTPWHVDIQQKIPLAIDRQTVRPAFLQDVYAEVLNATYDNLNAENVSELWVRIGSKDKRVKKETVAKVLKKRFGDKFVSRNPFDPNANDDALANGYNVINGSEMSREEWEIARGFNLVNSSSDVFSKQDIKEAEMVPVVGGLGQWAEFCSRCAHEFQGDNLTVKFVNGDRSNVRADYCRATKTLRFNMSHLSESFFGKVTNKNIDLLIHELGHKGGNHTEVGYHSECTRLAGLFTMKALKDPQFFVIGGN